MAGIDLSVMQLHISGEWNFFHSLICKRNLLSTEKVIYRIFFPTRNLGKEDKNIKRLIHYLTQ